MAKIVQGSGFKGVINYVLDKEKARLLFSEGIRTKDRESIIRSFIAQSQMNPISKPVAHISLNFSVQDKTRLTNAAMAGIALEYMKKMGYGNTQFIIVEHSDREHPHVHLIINRIDNNGKRISDKNEKLRSTKVCMELTKRYGLYIAKGKENVNRSRLKEPDKTKYEIYDALKATLPKCRNWKDLHTELKKHGITISFKNKGNTGEVQGIRFEKNCYVFNGSKIDRQFSYSKIDFQLKQNNKEQAQHIQPPRHEHDQSTSSVLENVSSVLGGLFDFQSSDTGYDHDEAEFLRQQKKKKKKRGFKL
jgi:hypothetical protein